MKRQPCLRHLTILFCLDVPLSSTEESHRNGRLQEDHPHEIGWMAGYMGLATLEFPKSDTRLSIAQRPTISRIYVRSMLLYDNSNQGGIRSKS